ncbi:MAG: hypothetical protein ACHQ1G_02600 [Planctomycetota bacterium]
MRRLALLLLPLALGTCNSSDSSALAAYCAEVSTPVANVTGTFRYASTTGYFLTGTVTFEQTGTTVRVTSTTYDNANDRELMGEGTIVGNRLDIQLVPINGDLDFSADVTFLFSPDGNQWCCTFADTNGDTGPLGSYEGVREWDCEELPTAVVDVTGTYRYASDTGYFLRGTIVFEQTGTTVRCTSTTYDNAIDRELEGEATIVGNRLDIHLVPTNGDLDFSADVTFLFSPDGDRWCCSFADTNGDNGPLGSYEGVRQN